VSVPLDAFDRPYEQHTPGPPHHKIIAGQRKDVMDTETQLRLFTARSRRPIARCEIVHVSL
jgi:hypothetical protein